MPLAVGLMSGTSIDGIDAALVRLSGRGHRIGIHFIDFAITPFPRGMREEILRISHPRTAKSDDICRLNFELGRLFAEAVKRLCRKNRVALARLGLIGSHGQTICHLGSKGTFQIGEPSVIVEATGVTTVADFRSRDIAAGGEGAPLAPYLHYLLFHDLKRHRAVHNLGGISSLTFIPKGGSVEEVIGFDTGPGNMVIDGLMNELTRGANRGGEAPALGGGPRYYDHGGRIASSGRVSLKLLKELLRHPFIQAKPPKTSGREEFGRDFIERIIRRGARLNLPFSDLIATVTALTAASLAENYRRFVFPKAVPDEIIFGGGGIHNKTLMKMVRAELSGVRISTFDEYPRLKIPADAAEAVCFAVLAYKTLLGEPANLPSVTGASHPVILGKIIPAVRGTKVSPSLS